MVLTAHDFRGHVSRSARGILRVLRVENSGDTEIGEPQVAHVVEDQVFWFDVPVEDLVLVQILERHDHACHEEL